MKSKVKVALSNHHVHLTSDIYEKLFFSSMEKLQDLHQVGEFACKETVTIKTEKNVINNVRVVGPFRNHNQVEITKSDAYYLGINPPVRRSGDLFDSETVTIIGEKGEITLDNCCIIADRHVHMDFDMANKYGLKDNQLVKVMIPGDKACILYAHIKISENGFYELHLDFDDANAAGIKNGDEVEIIY